MRRIIAEYIWIDSVNMVRSKSRTLIVSGVKRLKLEDLPEWNFDGSSTGQASGDNSEVILKPKFKCKDPFNRKNILVLCDCYDLNDIPIPTNHRYNANKIFEQVEKEIPWFGIEQEYVMYDVHTRRPLGWPSPEDGNGTTMEPQGKYYCGVGANRVFGRRIVAEHYKKCLTAGLKISGINAEVMPGQWEFQVGPCEGIEAGDHLWVARYILERVGEIYGVYISYDPKPEDQDKEQKWNGSGCHINFSSLKMREPKGLNYIYDAINKLSQKHKEHLDVYGDNSKRLTGTHETSSPDVFTSGVADRTASIRIPSQTAKQGCGYLEDRRPASDIDPYIVTSIIAETTLL